jgi:hypothetical protein
MSSIAQEQLARIAKARTYFEGFRTADGDEPDLDPTIEDSDGFVSYIMPVANNAPQELMDDIKVLGGKLQSLIGIVTAAVLSIADGDTEKLHDYKTWAEPFEQLGQAWFSQFSASDRSEDKEIEGIEVSTQFLQILLDAALEEGAAMANFAKFLKSQGESMRLQVENTGEGYKYASLSIVHDVFQLSDGSWDYVPKLKCFWTQFTKETFEITAGCASADRYRFKFDAKQMIGVFNYRLWQGDVNYRKKLDEFIQDLQDARIGKSKNYFEGIFKSKKPAST